MKKHSNLIFGSIIGLIVFFLILFLVNLYPNNKILKILSQGEILVGIIVAIPSLLVWSSTINLNKNQIELEDKKTLLEIKSIYDLEIEKVIKEYENKKHNHNDSKALLNINSISTSITSFEELKKVVINNKNNNPVTLNYHRLLYVLYNLIGVKIEYKTNTDNFEANDKYIKSCTTLFMKIIKILAELKLISIESNEYKTFSGIDFNIDFNIKDPEWRFELRDKVFEKCDFTNTFIKKVYFQSCEFIDCTINSNKELNTKGFTGYLYEYERENNIYKPINRNKKGKIYDNRIGIILEEDLYEHISIEKDTKNITNKKSYIQEKLNCLNSRVSISKNYVENEKESDFEWLGWHAINKETYKKHKHDFIFVISTKNNYECIKFSKNNLDKYIKTYKNENDLKYNFYFGKKRKT